MKGNSRHPSVPPPPPTPQSPKATAKYTNKDGSKFITVPKGSTPADSAQPSPTTSGANAASGPQSASNSHTQSHGQGQVEAQVQPVNKKKAKRRQKAAAKAAATQGLTNLAPPNGIPSPSPSNAQQSTEADHYDSHDEHPEDSRNSNIHGNGFAQGASTNSKKSKRKKKKGNAGQNAAETPNSPHHDAFVSAPHMSQQQRSGISKEKIWNTSSQEERERIKEFWLGLSEGERKNLVKVEKNAVLKKMKEQQKHTCSCTVCGRKRTAIEEELEGLYDAYYLELEQYANHPNQGEAPPMLGRRTSFSSMTGMHPRGLPTSFSSHHQPSHGQIIDHGAEEDDEEDDVEEEYSEDEQEEDDYSDDEPSEELHRSDYPADFLNFGNSLTVQGGILTVADDLLKNDGKKFIEMMEQLAERRMAREEDAREQFSSPFPHSNGDRNAHFHAGADDEVDDDDEYDDDYEDEDEDEEDGYDSEVEEETMTEEQRMEEGRRMFQIFAARMFEQRVLTAYREKVAGERQRMLIEEIDDEQRRTQEKQIKKQKEAQKKKERQARKKEQQAEEKARREEERLAEEKAKKAEEARQKELKRQREEEKRRQKEAQRKAEEEERKRKEAERQRRNHEREENERKAREAKEREKKAREEARLKEKEAREQREREAREQKEQQEREKKEREAKAKAEMEAAKAAKEKSKQENRAAQKAASLAKAAPPAPITLPNRPAQPAQPAQASVPAAAVPALPQQPAAYASPVIPVATPAFPIAPAPGPNRQTHQQDGANTSSGSSSQPGSVASQNVSPHTLTPVHTSPGPMKPPSKSGIAVGGTQGGGVHIPSPAPSTSVNTGLKPVQSQPNPFAGPSMNMPFQPTPQPPPGFGNHMQPQYPPFYNPANSFNRVAPGMMAAPPGFSTALGGRTMPIHPPGFPGPMDSPVSSFASLPGGLSSLLGKDSGSSHTRQGSGSFDAGHVGSSGQPISRPTPIGRPASVVHGQRRSPDSSMNGNDKSEEVHLGSSALLEDDAPQDFSARPHFGLLGTSTPGVRNAPGFGGGPFGIEPSFPLPHQNNPWNPAPPLQHNPFVPAPPGFPSSSHHGPWSQAAPPGIMGRNPSIVERSAPWSVTLRKALCSVCEELGAGSSSGYDGFIPLGEIMVRMKHMTGNEKEVLDICDTEGNPSNGGGSFIVRNLSSSGGAPLIRYIPDDDASRASFRPMKHPGDIGSPIVGSGSFNVRS